jgi:hypothetical protein
MAMTSLPLAGRDFVHDEIQPSAHETCPFRAATARTAHSRFSPATSGRIAGFVAAQQTHEQGLAASDPDGTLVLMPPAVPAVPLTTWTPPLRTSTRRAPLRIALGERKNDMTSISDRFCAAARRQVLPKFESGHAASVPEADRQNSHQLSDDAPSRTVDGGLAASGE